ncbi:MAG: 50S ribosomal protein L32 [Myxococcota bacterium]
MAVPKKRKSHSKTRMGRSHHALKPNWALTCVQCGAPHLPHTVCSNCGYYRGRQVTEGQI